MKVNEKKINLIFSRNTKQLSKKYSNILAGEWLLTSNIKKNYSYKVSKYHWEKKEKRVKGFKFIKKIYKKILKSLVLYLNKYHGTNYNNKYWEIIVYYFLRHYVFVIYDRWKIVEDIKKKNQLSRVKIFSYPKNFFIQKNSMNSNKTLHSKEWSDWIFSEIIREFNIPHSKIKVIKKNKIQFESSNSNLTPLKFKYYLGIKNKSDYFIKGLELPRLEKLKLHFLLKQIFFKHDELKLNNFKVTKKRFKLNVFKKTRNKFENFLEKKLQQMLPMSFLEGYKDIIKNLKYLNWPNDPKAIITSYDHALNDPFKIYTANKTMNGSKLFIFQHGGVELYDYCLGSYERDVCDKYFSWGHKSKDKITYPMFVSTTVGKKIKKKNPRGILIPIGEFSTIPTKNTTFPRDFSTTKIYRDSLIIFLSKVNKKILKLSTVKSNTATTRDSDFFTSNHIRSKFPNLKVKDSRKMSARAFEDSVNFKLVVETVNSTGFLESLNLNIPVILFTPKVFFSVPKEYLKFYKLLENVGIIFFNATKAANFINKNYDNLDKWWNSKKLQNNRKIFCENMCRSRKNSSLFLAQSLKKLSN